MQKKRLDLFYPIIILILIVPLIIELFLPYVKLFEDSNKEMREIIKFKKYKIEIFLCYQYIKILNITTMKKVLWRRGATHTHIYTQWKLIELQ